MLAGQRKGTSYVKPQTHQGAATKYQGPCQDLKIKFKHFQGHTYDIQEELH